MEERGRTAWSLEIMVFISGMERPFRAFFSLGRDYRGISFGYSKVSAQDHGCYSQIRRFRWGWFLGRYIFDVGFVRNRTCSGKFKSWISNRLKVDA
jgi:hypothetical protein